ncbi:MAG: hypothetical protein ABFD54_14950 [Armatimonadota bacterium]|nr:hypothetical protein [bacterium]
MSSYLSRDTISAMAEDLASAICIFESDNDAEQYSQAVQMVRSVHQILDSRLQDNNKPRPAPVKGSGTINSSVKLSAIKANEVAGWSECYSRDVWQKILKRAIGRVCRPEEMTLHEYVALRRTIGRRNHG